MKALKRRAAVYAMDDIRKEESKILTSLDLSSEPTACKLFYDADLNLSEEKKKIFKCLSGEDSTRKSFEQEEEQLHTFFENTKFSLDANGHARTNCAPLLADLFLYSYENEFLDNMVRSGHRRLARSFNLCYRYIDNLIVFNNKKFLDYLKEIYPSQLTVEKTNKSDHLADYLDLTFIIDSGGKLSTRLYDKRDFDFHIVNFPHLSSNIPSGPSYGVYISQLIRYARCCSHYDDFRYRHKCLVDRLLSQGYIDLRLEKSFKKFCGRYQDLIEKYQRSVNVMVNDSFPG